MRGKIFVITGPSGVGKGTLCERLLQTDSNLTLSVSATSRSIRANEQDGVNYHFKTPADFEAMIAHDQSEPNPERHHLLEWASYNGNYYGTPRAAVQQTLSQGKSALLEIETQGALLIKQKFPEACLIFIAPPSFEVLEQRLRSRGTDSDEDISNRLIIAQHELTLQAQFDFVFVNARLDDCLSEIQSTIARLTASPE